MTENIAQTIRHGWRPPEGAAEAKDLSRDAQRLASSLAVAEKWMEAAREGSPEMWSRAQYTRDQIEEELSRVAFELEVEYRKAQSGEAREKEAEYAALSDTLLEAYCILRDAPADLIGDGSPRARYELMGALMGAVDAANAELRRLEPSEANATA